MESENHLLGYPFQFARYLLLQYVVLLQNQKNLPLLLMKLYFQNHYSFLMILAYRNLHSQLLRFQKQLKLYFQYYHYLSFQSLILHFHFELFLEYLKRYSQVPYFPAVSNLYMLHIHFLSCLCRHILLFQQLLLFLPQDH